MAKFVIPETVAEIKVIGLDGSITTVDYPTEEQFYNALVRANVANSRGTFKQFGELEILENGKKRVWLSIVSKKDDALE